MNGKTLLAEAIEMKDEIVENRRAIHRAPEVGAHLPQTVQFVEEKLRLLGYEPRELGGGVVAELTGEDMGRCILLRADMDALKVKEKTDLPFRSGDTTLRPRKKTIVNFHSLLTIFAGSLCLIYINTINQLHQHRTVQFCYCFILTNCFQKLIGTLCFLFFRSDFSS